MDAQKLSNQQLFALITNLSLDREIRNTANQELARRKLSIHELDQLAFSIKRESQSLSRVEKVALVLFPLFGIIHLYFLNKRLLPQERIGYAIWFWITPFPIAIASNIFKLKGEKKISKQYWEYSLIGIGFYLALVILFAKFVLSGS